MGFGSDHKFIMSFNMPVNLRKDTNYGIWHQAYDIPDMTVDLRVYIPSFEDRSEGVFRLGATDVMRLLANNRLVLKSAREVILALVCKTPIHRAFPFSSPIYTCHFELRKPAQSPGAADSTSFAMTTHTVTVTRLGLVLHTRCGKRWRSVPLVVSLHVDTCPCNSGRQRHPCMRHRHG
jgi:hypothetical protein